MILSMEIGQRLVVRLTIIGEIHAKIRTETKDAEVRGIIYANACTSISRLCYSKM